MPEQPICVAVLGLGEAGGEIAADLAAVGARVRGYDPAVAPPEGITPCRDEADAAEGAAVVLSVNSATAALDALRAGLPRVRPDAVWADLNTAAPDLKRRLAEECARAHVAFADTALMSPVPGRGLRTPMLVSGDGAPRYAEVMRPLGAPVTVLDGPAGLAATRKLLRSVFFKGLAAAVVEALVAAREAGCEEWLRGNIGEELTRADAATVDGLEQGTYRHAARRAVEMAAASALLAELGVPPRVSGASHAWLEELRDR